MKDLDPKKLSPRAVVGYLALGILAPEVVRKMNAAPTREARQEVFGNFRDACELVLGDIPELLVEFSADSVAEGLLHD